MGMFQVVSNKSMEIEEGPAAVKYCQAPDVLFPKHPVLVVSFPLLGIKWTEQSD